MITLDDLSLPDDLYWEDEFGWTPVTSNLEYSLAGAGIVEVGKKLTGRSITLTAEPNTCLTTRATALALKDLADIPGKVMTLTLWDRTFQVMFAPGEIPFDAEPVFVCVPPPDEQEWVITAIRLIEIGES